MNSKKNHEHNTEASAESSTDQGNILREAISLAWPIVTQNLLNSLMFVVDALMLGSVGQFALAAHGIASPLAWTLTSLLMAVPIGTQALVSRYDGKDNPSDVRTSSVTALWLTLGVGLFGLCVLLPSLPSIVDIFYDAETMEYRVFSEATGYLWFIVLVLPINLVRYCITAILRGVGDTRTPMISTLIGITANILFNYLFIFGFSTPWIQVPPLAVWGAGIGTSFALLLESFLLIVHIFNPASEVYLRFRDFGHASMDMLRSLVRISLPATAEPMVRHSAFQTFIWIVSLVGQNALATNRVLIAIESLAFMVAAGVQRSTATMVGQSLGMDDSERAIHAHKTNTRMIWIWSLILSAIFLLVPEPFVALFSADREIIELGAICIQIAAVEQLFLQQAMVYKGSLQGAGDTTSPLWITAIGGWIFRVPLSAFFALSFTLPYLSIEVGMSWGLAGIWLATAIEWFAQYLIYMYVFKRGAWQDVEV